KIGALHWFQTFMVPYEGGWARSEDVNGGIHVSDELPPDAPPSIAYDPWPSTFLPPFHFANPVTGPVAEIPAAAAEAPGTAEDLARRAAVLAQEVQLLEDENEIEN